MALKSGKGSGPPEGTMAVRLKYMVPLFLAGLVLLYELGWKESLGAPGTWIERTVTLLLFLLVGPVMAWWGQAMAKILVSRMARSEAASEEKSRLLEQRNRQLQTVLQASRAMSAVLDLRQVAALVVEQVVTYTRFNKACLILGPDSGGGYTTAASQGLPVAFLTESIKALDGPLRSFSPVEWCQVTRQPVIVEKLSRDFRTAGLKAIYALAEAEGMIAVPLLYNDQFRGALMVYQTGNEPISTAEISLVSAIASQSALALENARLYTLTAQHRARLDSALEFFREVASALARTRSGISPLLHMVSQVTARLLAPACVQMMITKSARQSPITVTEAAGYEPGAGEEPAISLAVAALDGEQYGQFSVYLEPGRIPEPEDISTLHSFVNLTASALGNATLVAEMRQAVDDVEGAYMGTLEALTKALEIRDHETEGHCRRVVQYSLSIAQKIGVPEEQLVPLMRGALLHDIGKIGIPDNILKKQGPLDEAEWRTMRQHPQIGYEMLKGIDFLRDATPIILHHHERYDGSGYPHGLAGDAIPLGARIFGVADAYDAITSDRPYRRGRSHEIAMAEIVKGAGKQFDPQVVEVLQSLPYEELARIRGRDLDPARHSPLPPA